MGNTWPFDPSRNLPEPEPPICSDPNCPRCHGTYFVLDESPLIKKWTSNGHPDHPVPILRKEVVCLRPAFENDCDSYRRSVLCKIFRFFQHPDRIQIPHDPRSPEEARISMELKHVLDERR